MHDTFRLALHLQRRLLRLAAGSGDVSSMAAVLPGQPDHQRSSAILIIFCCGLSMIVISVPVLPVHHPSKIIHIQLRSFPCKSTSACQCP